MKLMAVLISVGVVCAGCTSENLFLIDDADFAAHDFSRTSTADVDSLSGHRIQGGAGLVIGQRRFRASPLVLDSGRYDKLTAWVSKDSGQFNKNVESGEVVITDALVFWSAGYAASPINSGCWAWTDDGVVRIRYVGKRSAVIVIEAFAKERKAGPADCPHHASVQGTAKILNLSNISPWLGKKGESSQDEAIP